VNVNGKVVSYNGTTWSSPTSIDPPNKSRKYGGLDAVSCASSSFCMAVDASSSVLSYSNTSAAKKPPVKKKAPVKKVVERP
jgi:hypothetical protein